MSHASWCEGFLSVSSLVESSSRSDVALGAKRGRAREVKRGASAHEPARGHGTSDFGTPKLRGPRPP